MHRNTDTRVWRDIYFPAYSSQRCTILINSVNAHQKPFEYTLGIAEIFLLNVRSFFSPNKFTKMQAWFTEAIDTIFYDNSDRYWGRVWVRKLVDNASRVFPGLGEAAFPTMAAKQ